MNEFNERNRRSIHWLQLTAMIVAAVGIGILAFVTWNRDHQIRHRNYSRIHVGMSQADLRSLLGCDPDYKVSELGLVTAPEGPECYSTNFGAKPEELRSRGFKECQRLQWHSPEITISVILDSSGIVVCRYKSGGQTTTWFQKLCAAISRRF